jgi:glycosyltransferase involved in cell wall biosynthesis
MIAKDLINSTKMLKRSFNMPLVSVIMSMYNTEKYVRETIESILNQTFKDFEFIIIDDASTDMSANIVQLYNDPRIRFYQNENNIGIVANLNKLLDISQGMFIARQDSDDISCPERLQIQVDFLRNNTNIGICGTYARFIGTKKGVIRHCLCDKDIRAYMLFSCPFVHPSVMMRASLFEDGLRYNEAFFPAEDYNFWFIISKKTKLANIPEILLNYRWHDMNISHVKQDIQMDKSNKVRHEIFEYSIGFKLSDEEKRIYDLIPYPANRNITYDNLYMLEKFLVKIQELNDIHKYYNFDSLKKTLFRIWSNVCRNNEVITPINILLIYSRSKLFCLSKVFSKDTFKTIFIVLLRTEKR